MLKVQIHDQALLAALEKVNAQIQDTAPLMREVAGILHAEVEENFDAEGRPRWRDLYPATKKARARKGHWPGKILQVSGHLANSVTPSSDEVTARATTNVVYAAIQHFGGTIIQAARTALFTQAHRTKNTVRGKKGTFKKGTKAVGKGGAGAVTSGPRVIDIPARPFMTLPESGIKKVVEAVKRFLSKGG